MLTSMIMKMNSAANGIVFGAEDIRFGTPWWFVYAGISCFLVLFAGIMSGLTLGLMSLGLVDLEILQRSGTVTEKKQAGLSLPTTPSLTQKNNTSFELHINFISVFIDLFIDSTQLMPMWEMSIIEYWHLYIKMVLVSISTAKIVLGKFLFGGYGKVSKALRILILWSS